jgi:hypothetical protein
MKFRYLLLSSNLSGKIIKNIEVPSCKNCIYYKPSKHGIDFSSTMGRCSKFGEKNIITDEIIYEYADKCRQKESLCGKEGKYFEKEDELRLAVKIINYKIQTNFFLYTFTSVVASVYILMFAKFLEK